MEKNHLLIKKASEYFNQGAWQEAYELYKKAGEKLGHDNVKANLLLCEKRIRQKAGKPTLQNGSVLKGEAESLKDEVRWLKIQLKKKDISIQERFEELALLTKMLEEKTP